MILPEKTGINSPYNVVPALSSRLNGKVSSVNMKLDGTMCPGYKLAHFVLCEKTEVNKTHQLKPGISAAILGVTEPH